MDTSPDFNPTDPNQIAFIKRPVEVKVLKHMYRVSYSKLCNLLHTTQERPEAFYYNEGYRQDDYHLLMLKEQLNRESARSQRDFQFGGAYWQYVQTLYREIETDTEKQMVNIVYHIESMSFFTPEILHRIRQEIEQHPQTELIVFYTFILPDQPFIPKDLNQIPQDLKDWLARFPSDLKTVTIYL